MRPSRLVRASTRLNPLVAALLRSPLHRLLSPGLMLVTVTGRRSGRTYTIPVGYLDDNDALVVLVNDAPFKQWWRNYLDGGPIGVELRRKRTSGHAQVVSPESEEFRRRAESSFRRARFIARIFGIDFDPKRGLTAAQLQQLAARAAMVRITIPDRLAARTSSRRELS